MVSLKLLIVAAFLLVGLLDLTSARREGGGGRGGRGGRGSRGRRGGRGGRGGRHHRHRHGHFGGGGFDYPDYYDPNFYDDLPDVVFDVQDESALLPADSPLPLKDSSSDSIDVDLPDDVVKTDDSPIFFDLDTKNTEVEARSKASRIKRRSIG